MMCKDPKRVTKGLDVNKYPDGVTIPCGKCIACKSAKKDEWCMRVLHELNYWDCCMFVTLTYSDDHLPDYFSLSKSDLQKFFKRLRKRTGKKLKYFGCGEYGEKNFRPHYHLIIFGLDYLKDEDWQSIKDAWPLCEWSMLGSKPFGDVNGKSIRYVISYLEKSINGLWEGAYDIKCEIPFHVVSKGMGARYAKDNKNIIEKNGYCTVQGYKKTIPRYYTNITGLPRTSLQMFAKEKEVDLLKKITSIDISRDDAYRILDVEKNVVIEQRLKSMRNQNDLNIKKRIEISKRSSIRDT